MDSPAAPIHLVVWRFTTVDSGGLCVMTYGLQQTVVQLVVNLDLLVLLVQPVIVQALLQGKVLLLCYVQTAQGLLCIFHTFGYCSLSKVRPWAKHHTSLPKMRVGALSSVSTLNHKRFPMSRQACIGQDLCTSLPLDLTEVQGVPEKHYYWMHMNRYILASRQVSVLTL